MPVLPDDLLRAIWQAAWRRQAAEAIQRVWRGLVARRRAHVRRWRNVMHMVGRYGWHDECRVVRDPAHACSRAHAWYALSANVRCAVHALALLPPPGEMEEVD